MKMGQIRRLDSIKQVLPLVRDTMPADVYESAEALDDNPSRILFGFFKGKILIGCCGYVYNEDKYSISWTAVDPQYQKKGIGQKLLDKVIEELIKMNAPCVYVETYEHPCFFNAIRFYMKNGFRMCGYLENYLRDGSAYLYLKREL